jgi:Zn-dependent protease with chaperone function
VTDPPGTRLGARRRRIEPLWDRIDANRVKVAAFLVVFVLSAGVALALFVGLAGLLLAGAAMRTGDTEGVLSVLPAVMLVSIGLGAVLATVHAWRMLAHPQGRLLGRFGAVPAQKGTFLETKSALHDMAIAAGYRYAPTLWVIPDCDRVNAFAIGLKQSSAVVGVTRGFAERLSADDQRAAFANLMARLKSGDTLWATAVSAVMGPIWAARTLQLRSQEKQEEKPRRVFWTGSTSYTGSEGGDAGIVGGFILGFFAVVLTELMMAGHERAAMVAAEKADAEGMLLLKDPAVMLTGLQRTLEANNTVPRAGEEYSMLFYCWAGFGYAPEDDPEMERLGRLREVLGAEGQGATAS